MDIAADADLVALLVVGAIALLAAFFVARPELWARLFFPRVDPRPAGLMRIAFGLVVIGTFLNLVPLVRLFLTDEGLWLTSMARANYGGSLRSLWHPEHGFEHWWSPLQAAVTLPSILHLRSDPPFVRTLYGLMLLSLTLMVLGVWTRWATIMSWVLVEQIYRESPIFYTGADFVLRAFLFLGIFCRWGEAYSVDSWRLRKRAILGAATEVPPLRRIPAWPLRLMMLQLACIYAASGWLKSGETWRDGTAIYYALNLDQFYRVPLQGLVTWLQYLGVLPLLTWITRWWEVLFPLALVGAALNGYERDRAAGAWPAAPLGRRRVSWLLAAGIWAIAAYVSGLAASHYLNPAMLSFRGSREQIQASVTAIAVVAPVVMVPLYRVLRKRSPRVFEFFLHWVFGRRVWLGFGLALHLGIDVFINVATFSQLMVAAYLCWLSGPEVDAFWRYLLSRSLGPGEGSRPMRQGLSRLLLAPFDRLCHRGPGPAFVVQYHPDETSVRRVALLRVWDLGHRLRFVPDESVSPQSLRLDIEGQDRGLDRATAGAALTRIFPGLWWLHPLACVPGLGSPAGKLALRLTAQS